MAPDLSSDPDTTGVDAVHVWAYPLSPANAPPVFAGAAIVAGARPDVGAHFGARFGTAGYDLTAELPPGSYHLVVFARSAVARTCNNARLVGITVR